jgi:CDP-glucose 4,6-dehydratase
MDKRALRLAIAAVAWCFAGAAAADEAAAKKWVDQEFQPSTLSKDQQLAELKWFIGAAKQLQAKGIKEISVVSETITTHEYEAKTLARAFEEITGIMVVVTSDKCYYNEEWVWGYREDSRLGGHDPYSGSKGCAELVVTAYQNSFFSAERHQGAAVVGSARAGNVIGGGDWALDRLVPDIMRSLLKDEPTLIRNPQATRPWQHVLEPLHGYLMLAERLYADGHPFASGWNFGPPEESERTVGWIIEELYDLWGVGFEWKRDANPGPPESTFLKLDASKARAHLGWRPKLDLKTTLRWIVDWTRRYQAGDDMREVSLADIQRFMTITPNA